MQALAEIDLNPSLKIHLTDNAMEGGVQVSASVWGAGLGYSRFAITSANDSGQCLIVFDVS